MSESETLAVLRDLFAAGLLAMAAAAAIYGLLRKYGDISWNLEGNVLTRPYGAPDVIVALLLLSLFGAVFFAGDPAAGGATVTADSLTVEMLLTQALSMLLLCAVITGYLVIVRNLNPAELFGLRQLRPQQALFAAVPALLLTVTVIWLVTALIHGLSGGLLPDAGAQETVKAFEKNTSPAFRAALAFMAIITAPLTEELIFRGFLYGVVKRYTDRWFAAAFTALIFAVVHFHVGTAPQLFLLGLGLAMAHEHTGCLLVPVFMHALFNGWNVAVMTLMSP